MSLDSVKAHFKEVAPDLKVIELEASSATVDLAAAALNVEPDEIAKTMAFWYNEEAILILSKGTARIDNGKFKEAFGVKAKMLKGDEVVEETGHPIGGVCPFGLKKPLKVYLDKTLKEFDFVYPAGGTPNSAVKISIASLEHITKGQWVDVSKELLI